MGTGSSDAQLQSTTPASSNISQKFSTDYASSFLGGLRIPPGKSLIGSALHRENVMN